MTLGLRVTGVVTGVIGAMVAGLFMLMGPWDTDPPLPDSSLIASYGYPLLLLFAGGALVRSARAGLWLAVLGLGCAILTVTPYVMDGSRPKAETIAFGVLVCLPGVALAVVAWGVMRSIALNRRPLMRR
jgi:hypothetical protein